MTSTALYNLIWNSRPLMQAAEAVVEQGLEGTGLTVRMRAVMEVLHNTDGLSVPDLAAQLHIQRQYVQLMVNETIAAGLTDKKQNPRHKKSSLICLTPKGAQLIAALIEQEHRVISDLAQTLDPADVDIALRVSQHLTSALGDVAKDRE